MKVTTDGFCFDFQDAITAFVFDETDRSKETYHGQPLKAVDIIAEFENDYVYIEIKDFDDPELYNTRLESEDEEALNARRDSFRWLKNYLKYKYRDSYLYRHAEDKVDKPIHYICLLNFENALNVRLKKELVRDLPVLHQLPRRWKRSFIQSCQVLNLATWNENFPKWSASRCSTVVETQSEETNNGAAS